MRLLLDTNAYSALRRGHRRVAELVRGAERLVFSAVVAGELIHGFRGGSRFARNRHELDAFLATPYVELIDVTLATADRFGRIAAALRRAGTPIPSNDIWIAAHALESAAEVLSFDAHFGQVPDVGWINPDRD